MQRIIGLNIKSVYIILKNIFARNAMARRFANINYCKTCSDPIKVSIRRWIIHSKESDKKYNRFDVDRFIDRCFLKELVKDYPNCYYCEVKLQYVDKNDTLSTIERLDNSIGHIKSNCVLACRKCNFKKVGQRNL